MDPRKLRGQDHASSRLSDDQVAEIRAIKASYPRDRSGLNVRLASQFGVTAGYISDIARGKSRLHSARPVANISWRLENLSMPVPFSGCVVWLGSLSDDGYGRFHVPGKNTGSAHIVAWEMVNGKVPDGLELDHLCRVRCCINPLHMEAIPHLLNVQRADFSQRTARYRATKTHCVNGHVYTDENTKWINGWRKCVICNKAALKRWYLSKGRDARGVKSIYKEVRR